MHNDIRMGDKIHLVGVGRGCVLGFVAKKQTNHMFVTALPYHGPEAARRVVVDIHSDKWHDESNCPEDIDVAEGTASVTA